VKLKKSIRFNNHLQIHAAQIAQKVTNRCFFVAMMRFALATLVWFVFYGASYAQEKGTVRGLLLDSWVEKPVSGAHIVNFTDSLATISTVEGMFAVTASIGDSIFITCIGYSSKAFVVDFAMLLAEVVVIRMAPRSYQLAEVEVNPFGSKAQFQQRFMELKVDDGSIDIIGVAQPKRPPREIPVTEDANEIKKAKYMMSPASFIYGNLSKDAKSRQELHRLQAEERKFSANEKKYNEKLVTRITGYDIERVRKFMDFCNFSESDIYQYNDYQLTIAILNKQKEFERKSSPSNQ